MTVQERWEIESKYSGLAICGSIIGVVFILSGLLTIPVGISQMYTNEAKLLVILGGLVQGIMGWATISAARTLAKVAVNVELLALNQGIDISAATSTAESEGASCTTTYGKPDVTREAQADANDNPPIQEG